MRRTRISRKDQGAGATRQVSRPVDGNPRHPCPALPRFGDLGGSGRMWARSLSIDFASWRATRNDGGVRVKGPWDKDRGLGGGGCTAVHSRAYRRRKKESQASRDVTQMQTIQRLLEEVTSLRVTLASLSPPPEVSPLRTPLPTLPYTPRGRANGSAKGTQLPPDW